MISQQITPSFIINNQEMIQLDCWRDNFLSNLNYAINNETFETK